MLTPNQYYLNRKSLVVQKGLNDILIAEQVKCTRQTVSKAMHGWRTSFNEKIASALHVDPVDFWPELYGKTDHCNKPLRQLPALEEPKK